MDVLNRMGLQLAALWRAMTPSSRLSSAAVLAAVVGGLAYLAHWQSSSTQTYLLGGHTFSIAEVHAVSAAFGKAGLKNFEIEGGQIKIPSDQLDIYLAAMADANVLPADFGDYLVKTIREQSPWQGPHLQEQAIRAARERVLGNAISKMQGIDSAQVFISVLDKPSFRGERLITASVDVKTLPDRPLELRQVRAIRSLVAGGTAGLKREQITVIDSNAGRDFAGDDADAAPGDDDAYLARQEAYEQRFEEAIRRLLTNVPEATVSVHVELAQRGAIPPTRSPAPALDAASAASPAALQGAANSRAKLGVIPAAATAPQSVEIAAGSENPVEPAAPVDRQWVPGRVTAAITIPGRYFEQLVRKNHPRAVDAAGEIDPVALTALRDEVCQKIQRHVLTVIPHDAQVDPSELVSVTSFDQVAARAPQTVLPAAAPREWWREQGVVLGLITVGAFVLAVFWSRLRAPVKQQRSDRQMRLDDAEPAPLNGPHSAAGPASRRASSSAAALREELAQSVRDNPDAAADILRSWIGNASS